MTNWAVAIAFHPFRMLPEERVAGPPAAAACSFRAGRRDRTERMNELGDPASSPELAALWARFARIVHLALQRGIRWSFNRETGKTGRVHYLTPDVLALRNWIKIRFQLLAS